MTSDVSLKEESTCLTFQPYLVMLNLAIVRRKQPTLTVMEQLPSLILQDFSSILSDVYEKSGNIKFVIIIDEWDCIVRNNADDPELVHEYLQFLHSLFKSKESKSFLGFGYITGILPIKKIKDESALNIP